MTKTPTEKKRTKRDVTRCRRMHLAKIRTFAALVNKRRVKAPLTIDKTKTDVVSSEKTTTLSSPAMDIRKIVSLILKGAHGTLECPHVMVGASQLWALLQESMSVWKTHAIFKSKGPNKGDWAETAFRNSDVVICHEHPRGRSNQLPFMAAVGDFVISENGKMICVEVKSKTSLREAVNTLREKKSLLQLWATMEILNYKHGRLVVYHIKCENNRPEKVVFVGSVDVSSEFSLFSELKNSIILGYMVFLASYKLVFTGSPLEIGEKNDILKELNAHFDKTQVVEPYFLPKLAVSDNCRRLSAALFDRKPAKIQSEKEEKKAKKKKKGESKSLNHNSAKHYEQIVECSLEVRQRAPKLFRIKFMDINEQNRRREKCNFSIRSLRTTGNKDVASRYHRRLLNDASKNVWNTRPLPTETTKEPRFLKLVFNEETLKLLTTLNATLQNNLFPLI